MATLLPSVPAVASCIPLALLRRKSFLTAIDLLVELASLQTAFLTLDEAIKTTNRCAGAWANGSVGTAGSERLWVL